MFGSDSYLPFVNKDAVGIKFCSSSELSWSFLSSALIGESSPACDRNRSEAYTNAAPRKNPIATGTNENCSPKVEISEAISIAGASKDQYEAANMTPAANPRLPSSKPLCKNLKNIFLNTLHIFF